MERKEKNARFIHLKCEVFVVVFQLVKAQRWENDVTTQYLPDFTFKNVRFHILVFLEHFSLHMKQKLEYLPDFTFKNVRFHILVFLENFSLHMKQKLDS